MFAGGFVVYNFNGKKGILCGKQRRKSGHFQICEYLWQVAIAQYYGLYPRWKINTQTNKDRKFTFIDYCDHSLVYTCVLYTLLPQISEQL